MEWYGAYGLLLAIIWIYVAILRLLALPRPAVRTPHRDGHGWAGQGQLPAHTTV